jgi:hypothetical protein
MRDDPLYDTTGAAKYLGGIAKPATLQWWRHIGRGPEYVKAEGRVFYRQSALDKFTNDGVVKPATEAA